MPYQIITVPFQEESQVFHPDALNTFVCNTRILQQQVEFFRSGNTVYWTVFLEYEPILEHEQRRSALTEAGQACYDRLREWLAGNRGAGGGGPPFVIARNCDRDPNRQALRNACQ